MGFSLLLQPFLKNAMRSQERPSPFCSVIRACDSSGGMGAIPGALGSSELLSASSEVGLTTQGGGFHALFGREDH